MEMEMAYLPPYNKHKDSKYNTHKIPMMPLAKKVDKLGYGVVRHYARDKGTLMNPTLRELVASYLYPNAINGILGYNNNLGYYKGIVVIKENAIRERIYGHIMQGLLCLQPNGICRKIEIVIHSIQGRLISRIITGRE
jgi:hypothetical protein